MPEFIIQGDFQSLDTFSQTWVDDDQKRNNPTHRIIHGMIVYLDISENRGTSKSSILKGFSV